MPFVFLSLSVVFGFLLIYPYAVYPFVARAMLPKGNATLVPSPRRDGPRQKVDIVLCAYNEEAVLARKIENCLSIAQRYGNVTVHVYSDGSTDGTPSIIQSFGDRIDGHLAVKRSGKSVGMNVLLSNCLGEIVVFTDANVLIDEEMFSNIYKYFENGAIGCISGNLIYVNESESSVAGVGAGFWNFEERLKWTESNSGSTIGADGSLFAIRRSLFRPVPHDIIDDMFTSLSILCDGYRVVQVNDVRAYERSTTVSAEEFWRKVRIACRCFNCNRLLWPRILKLPAKTLFKYVSHKVVRWFGGFWFIGGAVSWTLFCISVGQPVVALGSLLALALLFLSERLHLTFLTKPREMIMSVLAASLGVWKSLRGERFQTWNIASSSRGPETPSSPQ